MTDSTMTEIPLVERFRAAAEIGRGDGSTKSSRAMAGALDEGADLIEQQAAMLKAAVEALEILGKCGSCGGSGVYTNRGFQGGEFHVQQVKCRKCDGSGINPVARDTLASLKQPGGR